MVWLTPGDLHQKLVHPHRVRRLAEQLAELIPQNTKILDVGCGDGQVAGALLALRPDLSIEGLDVLVRGTTKIPVKEFDGSTIPFPDNSFDVVMLIDVLHHTLQPIQLLQESQRVARECILLKDHTSDGWLATPTLRLMDWVGNARHKVALTYRYFTRRQWLAAFEELGLHVDSWDSDLDLYGPLGNKLFGRSLHCLVRLVVRKT